jgi:hypothetical protein
VFIYSCHEIYLSLTSCVCDYLLHLCIGFL